MKIKKLLAYCVAIALLSTATTSCKDDDDEKLKFLPSLLALGSLQRNISQAVCQMIGNGKKCEMTRNIP